MLSWVILSSSIHLRSCSCPYVFRDQPKLPARRQINSVMLMSSSSGRRLVEDELDSMVDQKDSYSTLVLE